MSPTAARRVRAGALAGAFLTEERSELSREAWRPPGDLRLRVLGDMPVLELAPLRGKGDLALDTDRADEPVESMARFERRGFGDRVEEVGDLVEELRAESLSDTFLLGDLGDMLAEVTVPPPGLTDFFFRGDLGDMLTEAAMPSASTDFFLGFGDLDDPPFVEFLRFGDLALPVSSADIRRDDFFFGDLGDLE